MNARKPLEKQRFLRFGDSGSAIRILPPSMTLRHDGSMGESVNQVSCNAGEKCIIYVRMKGNHSGAAVEGSKHFGDELARAKSGGRKCARD